MSSLRNPSTGRIAAQVATVAFALVILLQLLLAMGIVPVSMAWGGTQTVLTTPLRLASLAAAGVLALFGYVIRRRAGLAGGGSPGTATKVLAWLVTAFLFLNTLGNFASSSAGEKLLFGPLSLVLAIACLIVAMSRVASADQPQGESA